MKTNGPAWPRPRYAAFWRLLHPLPSLLTVLAAGGFILLAAHGLPPLGRLAQLLAIETAMQFAISAFNDYFDRKVDAGRTDKPVAAGAITPRQAWLTGLVLALLALGMALPLGLWVFALTAAGLGGGLLYDAGLKYTVLSWLPFVLAFPTLPLWAWAGASPDGQIPARLFWSAPVIAVLVLGIHLADTIPDLSTDEAAGVRGLAHRLGLRRALWLCWAALAAGALLTLGLWTLLPYKLEWYLPGLGFGLVLMLCGITIYLLNPARVRVMALLLELAAMAMAIGWLAGVML